MYLSLGVMEVVAKCINTKHLLTGWDDCCQPQMLSLNPSGSVSPSVLTHSTRLPSLSPSAALISLASAPVSVIRV